MTQPDTGRINREWVVETYTGVALKGGVPAVFNSQKLTVVSEAYFLSAAGSVIVTSASVVAHEFCSPAQGTIGATLSATLAAQSFTAQFYGVGGSVNGTLAGTAVGTIQAVVFLERGT